MICVKVISYDDLFSSENWNVRRLFSVYFTLPRILPFSRSLYYRNYNEYCLSPESVIIIVSLILLFLHFLNQNMLPPRDSRRIGRWIMQI